MAQINTDIKEKIRSHFPILSQKVHGKPLVYLDNAATTQKPKQVIDAIVTCYSEYNSNIHRGVHHLSQQATLKYEEARVKAQQFINAKHSREIIFTKGATESINLVANSIVLPSLKDTQPEILITAMEHHSNILPWQERCKRSGALLKVAPVKDNGELDMEAFIGLLSANTLLVAFAHVSNTLGTINPAKEMIRAIRITAPKAVVVVDGAQAVPHTAVDVQDMDADFYCFSSHKMYGPSGVGVLYGKESMLNKLSHYQVGGGTIKTVTFEKTEYADLPLRFEAGTPNIEGGIALAAAIDYLTELGMGNIHRYENELLEYATQKISTMDGIKIIGTSLHKAAVLSFVAEGIHPFDIGTLLDQQGIAVRTGHHCTQPLMERFGISGTVRASFSFYNTTDEIDTFVRALEKSLKMLK